MASTVRETARSALSTRRPQRLTLLFGLLTGLFGTVLAANEFRQGHEIDYQAYYFAGRAYSKESHSLAGLSPRAPS